MKGQAQVVTTVLITGILVGAVSISYTWGLPLLQEAESRKELENFESDLIKLEQELARVSESGSDAREVKDISIGNGEVNVVPSGDYIEFRHFSEYASYPSENWSIIHGEGREGLSWTNKSYAEMGEDSKDVLAVKKASQSGQQLIYRLEFRNMLINTSSVEKLELVDITVNGNRNSRGDVEIQAINKGKEEDLGSNGVMTDEGRLDRTRTLLELNLK